MTRAAIITIVALGTLVGAFAPASSAGRADHAPRCDRGTIVFSRFADDGTPNLFATSPCTGAVTQLTTTGAHHADLSADGRRLAYDSIPPGQDTTDVFVANSDGSQAHDITNAPGSNDILPDFSPDGQQVAYASGTAGLRDARIVVQDLRSGQTRAVTPANLGQETFDPSWSPSGGWIAFDTFDQSSGASYIWIVRANGQDLHRITSTAADACQPDWGPNWLIAYTGDCDQEQSHLFIRDPFGLFVHQLTSDPDGGSSQLPAFSPDGRSLTFSRFDADFNDGDVWQLDLLTGTQTDLVTGPTFDYWSVWGPARS
jgi:Tol biopolymer transport system component